MNTAFIAVVGLVCGIIGYVGMASVPWLVSYIRTRIRVWRAVRVQIRRENSLLFSYASKPLLHLIKRAAAVLAGDGLRKEERIYREHLMIARDVCDCEKKKSVPDHPIFGKNLRRCVKCKALYAPSGNVIIERINSIAN